MLKELLKVFGHSIVYGLTGILSTFVSVFLIPIYTRILTPAEYGVIALLTTLSLIILIFTSMGMGTAVFWAYFNAKEEERKEVVFTAFLFLTIFPLLVSIIFYLSSGLINRLLFGNTDNILLIRLSAWTIFFNAGIMIPLALLRAEGKPSKFVLVTLSQTLVSVILSIWFVVVLRWGVAGAFWASLFAAIFGYIFSLLFTVNRIAPRFSYHWLREMLRFGVPMMPAGLAMWAMNSSDRYFLNAFAGTADVGIYIVGYKVGMFVALIVGAFQLAYGPFIFSIFNERPNPKEYYRKIATYYFFCIFLIALGLSIFAKEIIQILSGPNFHAGYTVVPFVAYSYVAFGLYFTFSTGVSVMRKTYLSTIAVLLSGILNLTLNFLLISKFGMIGAAIASFVSFSALAGIELAFSQQVYKIPFEFRRFVTISAVGVLLIVLAAMINLGLITSILIKTTLLAMFPVILYIIGFFDKREVEIIKKMVNLVISTRGNPIQLINAIKEETI